MNRRVLLAVPPLLLATLLGCEPLLRRLWRALGDLAEDAYRGQRENSSIPTDERTSRDPANP